MSGAAKTFSPRMSAASSPKRRKTTDSFLLSKDDVFTQVHPNGVKLSEHVIGLMEKSGTDHMARTFDEVHTTNYIPRRNNLDSDAIHYRSVIFSF